MQLLQSNTYIDYFLLSFILLLNIFFTKSWHYFFHSSKFEYHSVQKLHDKIIPRIGGFVLFLSLIFYNFFKSSTFSNYLILSLIRLIFYSMKEDLFFNVSASKRLIAIALSALIFLYLNLHDLKILNIYLIQYSIQNKFLLLVFFTFCLVAFTNAFNMIDGLNGLATLTVFFILIALLISPINLNSDLTKLINILLIFNLSFFLFNFPFQKLFLGDSGAYLSGFIIGIVIIFSYQKSYEFGISLPLILIIYPTVELIFSVLRKIVQGKSPFCPDRQHLHILIFDFMQSRMIKLKANNLSTIILLPLISFPLYSILLLNQNYFSSYWFLIIFFILIYFIYFIFFYFRK